LNERFREALTHPDVRKDILTVGDFTAIYCKGKHKDRVRTPLISDAVTLGAYGTKVPVICEECATHVRYAEARRAYCTRDPKPFCAHCDTHCYKQSESDWQRTMMTYSGPRSAFHGYAIEGIKHMLEARKWRREMAKRKESA